MRKSKNNSGFLAKYKFQIGFGLVILAIISLRFLYLDADSVSIVSLNNQDEGNYSQNTRNFVVEGTWIKDETNFYLISPVFSFLQLPLVKAFGVHFWSFRLINALASILTILAGYLFLKQVVGRKAAVIFALLLGFSFFYLLHNRIAIPETTQGLFFLTALICYFYASSKGNAALFFASGVLSSLTYLTKPSAVIIFALVALLFVNKLINYLKQKNFSLSTVKSTAIQIFAYVAGAAVPIALWHWLLVVPHAALYRIAEQNLIERNKPLLENLTQPTYLSQLFVDFLKGGEANVWIYFPIPLILCALFIAIFLKRYFKSSATELEIILFLWLIIGLLDFMIVGYKPARFFVTFMIPISIMSAIVLSHLRSKLQYLIVATIILFNAFFIGKYILLQPHFSLRDASNQLEHVIENSSVTGDSLIYLNNSKSKVFNYYFPAVQANTTFDIAPYLKEYHNPDFIILGSSDQLTARQVGSTNQYKKVESLKTNTDLPVSRDIDIYHKTD